MTPVARMRVCARTMSPPSRNTSRPIGLICATDDCASDRTNSNTYILTGVKSAFCITMNKNDLPLANAILKKIGYGFIRIKSKENAVVLTVSPVKGLIIILNLISHYLRTPKINQVNKLIN